jgi:hypothetical protein
LQNEDTQELAPGFFINVTPSAFHWKKFGPLCLVDTKISEEDNKSGENDGN